MTVYADIVFAVNTVVNYLLLLLGARLTGFPARHWRTFLGASVGGGYAVCVLIPAFAFAGTALGKVLCFLLMCMTSYGIRIKAIQPSAITLLCGGALAGFVFLLTQMFSVDVVAFDGHIYYPLAAKVLVLMAGFFYLAAALIMAGSLKHRTGETVALKLSLQDRSVSVRALMDTGNTLHDPVSGRPVVVLEWQRGAELLGVSVSKAQISDAAAALVMLETKCPEFRPRLISYRTVGTNCGLLLAVPCRVKAGRHKEVSAVAAFSPNPVSDGGGYEALIGGTLI